MMASVIRAAPGAIAAACLAACGGEGTGGADGSAPGAADTAVVPVALVTDGFTSDAECVECHRDVARGYEDSGMSRSFGPATPDRIIESFAGEAFYHEPSDRHYEMTERDGHYYVKRFQRDPDGTVYNVIEEAIDYIIGSGAHSRSYVYRNESGELFQLPVAWYAERNGWGIHPGFDNATHEGFMRRITRDCLSCHNAYPDVPVGSDLIGQLHLFPETLPHGIGCQRCHGAGAEHARLADDPDAPLEAVVAAIANPPRMDGSLGEDVCLQCHLQPASRLPSRLAVFGRGAYGFRPGEPLHEAAFHMDFGDEATRAARFQSNHQPYRLYQSRCWQESDGAMTCLTCHDPHMLPAPDERVAHYRDKCFQCHAVDDCDLESMASVTDERPYLAGVAPDDCIACHMPRRRAQDVIGEIVHDHVLRRMPPPTDPVAPLAEARPVPGVPRAYWPDRAPAAPADELYLAAADVQQEREGAVERLAAALERHAPDAIEPYAILGEAYISKREWARAVDVFRAMLELREDLPVGHISLGRALTELGRLDEAAVHFERALALAPTIADAHFGKAIVLGRRGDVDGAITHLREAVRLRPHDTDALANLAGLHQYRGEHGPATTALRHVLAVEPEQVDAYLQLGLSLLYVGQTEEAVRSFDRGRRRRPEAPRFVEALAMALALDVRFTEAERALAEARALDGVDLVSCLLVDALIAQGSGDPDRARGLAMEAMERSRQEPPPADLPVIRSMLFDSVRQVVR
jgi:tetratricopeptide (TPR) repeat protein